MAAVPAIMGVAMLVPAMGPISQVSPVSGFAFLHSRTCVGQEEDEGGEVVMLS